MDSRIIELRRKWIRRSRRARLHFLISNSRLVLFKRSPGLQSVFDSTPYRTEVRDYFSKPPPSLPLRPNHQLSDLLPQFSPLLADDTVYHSRVLFRRAEDFHLRTGS